MERILDRCLVDPVADKLGYLLRRASVTFMAGLGESLAEIGLRPVEGTILMLVGANPGCTQSDLGRVLDIQRANMAPLTSALVAKGLVRKKPADGRSIALYLTPDGETLRLRSQRIMDWHDASLLELLGDANAVRLRHIMAKIVA